MNPLVVLAVVGVGLAWLYRRRADEQAQAQQKTQQQASDPSTPTGSYFSAETEVENARDRSMQGTMAGVSIGMAVYGPIGALVGAVVGLVAGMYFSDHPSPYDWPWWLWGMPCTNFGNWWDDDGNYNLPLPSADGSAITVLTVPAQWFRDTYKTDGKWDSHQMLMLARAGMFAWRPREQETPFSKMLYETAPWLIEYEDRYLVNLESLVDWQDATGTSHMTYFGSFGSGDSMDRQILGMRRVFAAVAIYGVDTVLARLRPYADSGAYDMRTLSGTTLYGLVRWMRDGDQDTILQQGIAVFADGSAGSGYPGAWRYTDAMPTATVAQAPAKKTQLQRVEQSPITSTAAAPTMASRTPKVLAHKSKASTISIAITTEATENSTDARIQVWLPGPDVPGTGDMKRFESRTDRVLWGESHVVALSSFVAAGAYRTVSAAREALESATLAYGPYTSPEALAVWRLMFPGLANPQVEARRVHRWGGAQ